jgi:FtsH-binding integral membrane protein
MAPSTGSYLGGRIDTAALPLAVGDVLVLALLLSLGTARHNGFSYLTEEPVGLALTLLPFFVGWLVAGPLIGAYSAGAAESAKAAIPLAIRSWVVAGLVGVALRVVLPFDATGGIVSLAIFFGITLVVGAVGLGVWRWLYFKLR